MDVTEGQSSWTGPHCPRNDQPIRRLSSRPFLQILEHLQVLIQFVSTRLICNL